MISKARASLAAMVLVMGCASYQDVADAPVEQEFSVARNYQAVYASSLSVMRKCLHPGSSFFPSPAAVTIEAQLYPDLGYGEIIHGLSGLAPGLFSSLRIMRAGSGAKVQIKTANQIPSASANTRAWLAYWATGGQQCPRIGASHPPA